MRYELSTRELNLLAFLAQYAEVAIKLKERPKNPSPIIYNELLHTFKKAHASGEKWLSPFAIRVACELLGHPVPRGIGIVPNEEVQILVAKLRRWQKNCDKMITKREHRRKHVVEMKREYSTGIPNGLKH